MSDYLGAVRAADAVVRTAVRGGLKAVYTENKDAVLTYRQRDCVVQYICEVCDDYRLSTQTAFTAMTYFDRYMAARGPTPVARNEAELISLASVLVAAKFLERQSPGISDLCAVAANAHPRADFTAAELLLLELLRWRLHVVTPHSYVPVLIDGTDHTGYTAAEVRKHSDFFVDLASFELLAFEYTGGAIAAAAVYCALWRLKLVDSVEPAALQAMPPSSRLSQLVAAAGGEGTATLADAATCVDRMVKALHALEADHARIAKEKERKQREKEEADRAAADAAQEAADAARERAAAGAAGAEEAPLSPSAAACHEVQELHTCDASFAPVNTALEVSERADSPDSIIPGVAGAAAGAKAAAAPAPSAAAAGKRARAASAADEGGERKKAAAARR